MCWSLSHHRSVLTHIRETHRNLGQDRNQLVATHNFRIEHKNCLTQTWTANLLEDLTLEPHGLRTHKKRSTRGVRKLQLVDTQMTQPVPHTADAQCEESDGVTTRTAAAKNVLTVRPVWHGPAGIWLGTRTTASSHTSCDNWIEELAWFLLRSRRGSRCDHCRVDTSTRDRVAGKIFQVRLQPGHQEHPSGGPSTRWMTAQPLTARCETFLYRYRCRILLADIPKSCDWNEELSRRVQMWETGEVHDPSGRSVKQLFAARCKGGSFASRLGEKGRGPGLRDPTVTLSLLPLHRFTVTLRALFWIQASDQSPSRVDTSRATASLSNLLNLVAILDFKTESTTPNPS